LGKYFETALAKWTAKNFKDGKPVNPNPPPPYSHQKEFALIRNTSGESDYLTHGRRPLRLFTKMLPVVCAVDEKSFELPEKTVLERQKQFGAETRWLCNFHLTEENKAKYFG
jgi:hypothetical protein